MLDHLATRNSLANERNLDTLRAVAAQILDEVESGQKSLAKFDPLAVPVMRPEEVDRAREALKADDTELVRALAKDAYKAFEKLEAQIARARHRAGGA